MMLSYPGRFVEDLDGEGGVFDEDWVAAQLSGVAAFEKNRRMPTAVSAFGISRYQLGAADFLDAQMTAFEQAGMNFSLWAWYPRTWPATDDAFDLTRGPDPANHAAVPNPLLEVVAAIWQRNRAEPEVAG
jgi:hypothetical protein